MSGSTVGGTKTSFMITLCISGLKTDFSVYLEHLIVLENNFLVATTHLVSGLTYTADCTCFLPFQRLFLTFFFGLFSTNIESNI